MQAEYGTVDEWIFKESFTALFLSTSIDQDMFFLSFHCTLFLIFEIENVQFHQMYGLYGTCIFTSLSVAQN